MQILGPLLMLTGAAGAGYVAVVWGLSHPESRWGKFLGDVWPFGTPAWIEERHRLREETAQRRLEVSARPPDVEAVVRDAPVGDFIEVMGRPVQYQGKMRLLELQFFGDDKEDKRHVDPRNGETLREFTAVLLAGHRLLTEQPVGEGKAQSFFLYEDRTDDMPTGFAEMLKGTKEGPGPAARFAKSNQRDHVEFEVFGKTWVARDIVWADVQAEGGKTFVRPGTNGTLPRVATLLAVNRDDAEEWLQFVDLRNGQGSDTVWVGRKFDPATEVTM